MEPDTAPTNSSDPQIPPVEPLTPSSPMAGTGRTIMPPSASESPSPTPAEEPAAPALSQTFTPHNAVPPPPAPFTPTVPSEPQAPFASSEPAVPAQPAAPLPDAVVGDGGIPVAPAAPVFGAPDAPTAAAKPKRRFPKKLLISIVVVILVLGGGAGYYFGYYMNSSVIYSQSLKNTGKGYDKLVSYADQQSQLASKGYTGSGSYTIKTADVSTDGKLAFKGDGVNNDLTFDLGVGVTRINADIRTVKSSGTTPDLYVKASGIKGLGTLFAEPALDPEFAKLDNNWIAIDHTLLENLDASAMQSSTSATTTPTHDQVIDEARAFGNVNQQYLFSTTKDKAVTTVTKKYGMETINGHKTYHYQVALQKDNVKKYILAQRDALKASTLNDWLKKNKYDTEVYNNFNDAANSTKNIKNSDTFDVWTDVNRRIVYKVRFSDTTNPAKNYVDVGLDYKGGSNYPFFVAGQSKDSSGTATFSLSATVNTQTGNTDAKLNAKTDGSDGVTFTSDFNFKPSTTALNIGKPTGAIPLSQVLSDLGLGSALDYTAPATTNGPVSVQLGNKLSATGKTASAPVQTTPSSLLQRLLDR